VQGTHTPTNKTHFQRLEQSGFKWDGNHSPATAGSETFKALRAKLHFSLRRALALGTPHSKPDFKTLVFSDLQTLEDACFDRPCRAVQDTLEAGQPVCLQLLRKGVTGCKLLPGKLQAGSDTARRAGRVLISALIPQTITAGDSGGAAAVWAPFPLTSCPSSSRQPCPGCITPAGMGTAQHRLHPGLGQLNPARDLAPPPFPRIPAPTPLLVKAVSPQ